MQLVRLDRSAHAVPDRRWQVSLAIAGVVGCVGDDRFGSAALERLNRALPLCWLSVYSLFDGRPPEQHLGGSYEVPDRTSDAFRFYRNGIYLADPTFDAARELLADGGMVLIHWRADEIPSRHRDGIYTRHALKERASIVTAGGERSLVAINLYRHRRQRSFDDAELELLALMGAPLAACVELHLRRRQPTASDAVLRSLPRREREVCARLLKGWTHEGIAADLGLSAATVKTYRDRAFERLGIHHRNELFALALKTASG
ncbi:MAG TPA: LuxR C-terminal-related transcriptional regulator [Burkholderiaceae bacterium]|nr:LuxR C-terminal-related transcriptional regulator [Burkholderiaceae bacterium]